MWLCDSEGWEIIELCVDKMSLSSHRQIRERVSRVMVLYAPFHLLDTIAVSNEPIS